MKNLNKTDEIAFSELQRLGSDPMLNSKFGSNETGGYEPFLKPKKKSIQGEWIVMYTPESDFMSKERVRKGSPRYMRLLRASAAMEPDGPEAQELKRLGIK